MTRFLLFLLLLIVSGPLWAYDFEHEGVFYNITDAVNKTVEVTASPNNSGYEYYYDRKYHIDESVEFQGVTYTVTAIGEGAFANSHVTGVFIPYTVTKIGSSAFGFCSDLKSVDFDDNSLLTEIGNAAFYNCSSLWSIEIPELVTSIGRIAFAGCSNLTYVSIGNSVTSIGDRAFYGCSALTEVNITDLSAWCKIDFGNEHSNPLSYAHHLILDGGELTNLEIPTEVTSIAAYAFCGYTELTSVIIPNTVSSIGVDAFKNCENIIEIYSYNTTAPEGAPFDAAVKQNAILYIPSSGLASYKSADGWKDFADIRELAMSGFYDFDLDGVYYRIISIPDLTVEVVAKDATYYSYYGDITIPETVTYRNREFRVISIGSKAFLDCGGLRSLSIPNTITSIGEDAFSGCSGLVKLDIEDGIESINGLNFPNSPIETLYWGRNTSDLFMQGKRTLKELTISNTINNIADDAFSGCSGLVKLNIGDGTESISGLSFPNSPIETLYLGRNLDKNSGWRSICSSDDAYRALKEVIIGNSVTTIGYEAFYSCSSLTSVSIGNSVTSIGDSAFEFCSSLTSVSISNSVTSIGYSAFAGCSSLTSVSIGNSVINIGGNAFFNCTALTEVNITDLSAWCKINFNSNTTAQIHLGMTANPLRYANHLKLNGEEITNLVIPNDVTKIMHYTFYNCTNITSVTIPNSVTEIGDSAFEGCTGLTEVNITDLSAWCKINFNQQTFIYSLGLTANPLRYTNHLKLNGEEITNLVIPNDVTNIMHETFYNCTNITSVTIPNSVTEIGDSAFEGCTGLTEVNITDISTWYKIDFGNIQSNPLSYAHHLILNGEELTNLVIPNDITKIKKYTFRGCVLNTLVIESGENSIDLGGETFSHGSFSSLYLGRTITGETNPFKKIAALQKVTLGSNVTSLQSDAFVGCTDIKELVIESSETAIKIDCNFTDSPIEKLHIGRNGTYAFNNRVNLKEVSVGDNVTSLPTNAFNGCSNITTLKLGKKLETIGAQAFTGCTSLTDIYSTNPTPPMGVLFEDKAYLWGTLYVVKGSKDAYETADGWKDFWEIIDNLPFEVDNIWYNIDEYGKAMVVANPTDEAYVGNITIPATIEIDGTVYDVTSIDAEAFVNALKVTSITIEDADQSLEVGTSAQGISTMSNESTYTFGACKIDSVYIGRNLIYQNAPFKDIASLKKVSIGSKVSSLGGAMFAGCENIETVSVKRVTPPTDVEFDANVYNSATLKVPVGTLDVYSNADGWKKFFNIEDENGNAGIDEIFIDGDGNIEPIIEVVNDKIIINGGADAQIAIYTINGTLIYNGMNRPVSVANGIYVVVVNGVAIKVVI